jgi:two-component system CheB/CheR fusion protein
VDDYHETGASFAALLNLEGAIPSVAHSALDALTLLKSNAYDVLISDLDMPGMDGYAFIRQVRGGSKRAQIRAIAASGYNREEDKRRVMEAGFDALVEKPVSLEFIMSKSARRAAKA